MPPPPPSLSRSLSARSSVAAPLAAPFAALLGVDAALEAVAGHRVHAERGEQLAEDVVRRQVAVLELLPLRTDLVVHELADRVADHLRSSDHSYMARIVRGTGVPPERHSERDDAGGRDTNGATSGDRGWGADGCVGPGRVQRRFGRRLGRLGLGRFGLRERRPGGRAGRHGPRRWSTSPLRVRRSEHRK